ncbi:oxidation resistance protein 1 [Coccidioides immitis H538.4]|uniref:Oxidation resistance protein 1 n=1 Tax=Coccidioides immitis H538.4 TaxID=396776 RepID=A0A0J8RUM6_COCIT|nr:oxidation resistance protein 1 [Coccidioides immitis H538.4]
MSSSEEAQTAHHEPPSDDLQASAPPPQSPRHQEQQQQQQPSLSTTSYFTFPVTHVVSGLYRRLTDPAPELPPKPPTRTATEPMNSSAPSVVFTPRRTASPFQPPPLTPLTLNASPAPSTQLLTHALAEEIRLLVPPRLQLVDTWTLAYSLDRDGSSLSTLFEKSSQCAARSQRAGYVLVVKNVSSGNNSAGFSSPPQVRIRRICGAVVRHLKGENLRSGTSTPDRIRFKAFPYSGVNDYMILCETGFLSVGGGDGHYGLWLDDSFEKGVSSPCLTFGNEPLCDEGTKFDVLNVELWYIGN